MSESTLSTVAEPTVATSPEPVAESAIPATPESPAEPTSKPKRARKPKGKSKPAPESPAESAPEPTTSTEPAPESPAAPAKGKKGKGKAGAKPTSKSKAKKGKGKAGAKPTSKSGPAPKTALGSRVGSQNAKFESALTGSPQNMRQLMESSGVERSFFNWLKALCAAGLVVSPSKGLYKLSAAGLRAVRSHGKASATSTESAPAEQVAEPAATAPEQASAPAEQTAAA